MEIKFNIPEMPEYGSGAKADFSQIEKQSDMTKEQAIASSIASDSTRIATEIASLGNQKRELQAKP